MAHQACFTRLISSPRHLNPISLRLLTVLQSCRRARSVGTPHDAECSAVQCSGALQPAELYCASYAM